MGVSQTASTPSHLRYSILDRRPGRSPLPSPFESWNEMGAISYTTADFHQPTGALVIRSLSLTHMLSAAKPFREDSFLFCDRCCSIVAAVLPALCSLYPAEGQ